MRQTRFLAAGAHPDDIEIGAGALVHRLGADGHEVWFLILTDEEDREHRRTEAIAAAAHLGVPSERVLFAGLTDSNSYVNATNVSTVRSLMQAAGCNPAVVITHSANDSHNDHRLANELLRATFRQKLFLLFSIHISAETSAFSPRLFVGMTEQDTSVKQAALDEHVSQRRRISKVSLEGHEEMLATLADLRRAEAFEIFAQGGSDTNIADLMEYNDSPFHQFWYPLVQNRDIYLFYQQYRRQPESISKYSSHHESSGRDVLREAFVARWFPRTPVHERFSNSPDAEALLRRENILLAGGAVDNPITRNYFNRFSTVDWVVEYDMPRREPVYLLQRSTGRRVAPRRTPNDVLIADVGVVSIIPNPYRKDRKIVAAAGVHGLGTQGILVFLADPTRNPELLARLMASESGQVPVEVSATDLTVRPLLLNGG
jgi:LmbE family N-acetylglucosaminyl deacetylase